MKQSGKQPTRASKAAMPEDRHLPPSDVSPQAGKGGDKESNEPLRKHLKGGTQARTSPGRKPGR